MTEFGLGPVLASGFLRPVDMTDLFANGFRLLVKGAKPLPSSD